MTVRRVGAAAGFPEFDTKTANSIILACKAILSGIRTDGQEKKIAELEGILNERE